MAPSDFEPPLEVEPFSVRLDPPMETARGPIRDREGFLVRVEYEGTVGLGEATPLLGWTESREECRAGLERAHRIATELDWGVALASIDTPAARHGLSLALVESKATAAGQPLYRTLGAESAVEAVPVNAVLDAGSSARQTAEQAREATAAGFECLKIKVGTNSLEDDVERVRAVRTEVGEAVALRVDANGAWTPEQARQAIAALAELQVDYLEQPLPTTDLEATASLTGNGVDIALDESLAVDDLETIIEANAADVLILKPMVLGGPDLAKEAATRCLEVGIEPIVSTTLDAVVARTAAVHVAASIPAINHCGLATADRIETDLAPDPAPVSNGTIHVPQGPGLGFQERP